jgi:hypothetical protein
MIIGALIGLAVNSYFLIMLDEADPAWGQYWMIRPILVGIFAGTMAGLCNFIILRYRSLVGVNRVVAVIISLIVSFVGLWMGIVLGYVGTMWN